MNNTGLLPRQVLPAEQLLASLHRHSVALDASDMGTGKTYVACSVIRELDCPTVVVCPKVMIPVWNRVLAVMGTDASVINYEMLRTGKLSHLGTWSRRQWYNPRTGRNEVIREFKWSPAVRLAVFDEAHRCGGDDTLNAEMLKACKRQQIKILGLSATPASSPLGMDALGFVLGLHSPPPAMTLNYLMAPGQAPKLPSFPVWLKRNKCGFDGMRLRFFGTAAERAETMSQIHHSLGDKLTRVKIADIPDFPQTQITAELYSMADPLRVDQLYREMEDSIKTLRERAATDKDPESTFTRILRMRQELELLMVPPLVDLAVDALNQGWSVPIFVNFKATIGELAYRLLGTHGFPCGKISGEFSPEANFVTAQEFRDDKFRVQLCQIDSGGVGISLNDVRGEFPRYSLLSPGQSAINLRQALGRPVREGTKSKTLQRIVIPDHEIMYGVHRNLAGKLNNLDSLVDADLTPENLRIDGAI